MRPVPTQWRTIQEICASLLESEAPIYAIISGREFVQVSSVAQILEHQQVKELVTHSSFIPMLKKALKMLKLIAALIVKYQSDSVHISEVLPNFCVLPVHFKVLYTNKVITQAERDYLCALLGYQFQFMYEDTHRLSYRINPCFIG